MKKISFIKEEKVKNYKYEEYVKEMFPSGGDIDIPLNMNHTKLLFRILYSESGKIRDNINLVNKYHGQSSDLVNEKDTIDSLSNLLLSAQKKIFEKGLEKLKELGEGKYLEGDGILVLHNVDGTDKFRVFVTPNAYMGEYQTLEDAKNVWYITTGKSRDYEINVYEYINDRLCAVEQEFYNTKNNIIIEEK